MKKQKIVITGASGLLGRALMHEFSNNAMFDVIFLAHNRVHGELIKLNLLELEKVRAFIVDEQPSIIIHAATERKPDKCEDQPQATRVLNVDVTTFLAKIAEEQNMLDGIYINRLCI